MCCPRERGGNLVEALLRIAGVVIIAGGMFPVLQHRIVLGGIIVVLLGLVLASVGWLSGAEVRVSSDQPADSAVPTLPINATPASSP